MARKSSPRREGGAANGGSGGNDGPPGDRDQNAELQSSPVVRTALIDGVTFTNKAVQYAEIDGLAMFEGDIVLGTAEQVRQETESRQKFIADGGTGDAGPVLQSVGISGAQFRWPGGVVPFEIDPALPNQQRVTDAIAHWHANTTIRFVPRTAAHTDFVRFVPGGGCSSQVGRRGGQQNVTLGPGCTAGNAIHEIGHTIGLWHEQSREDRDHFVTIRWANITPGFEHNFDQHITDGDDLGAYDYGSIMHYPRNAFTRNGQDTIVPVQAGAQIGQRTGLSPGDLAGVRMMYPPPKSKFLDDPIVKRKVVDDVKLKFADDPIKRKVFDDVKLPALDVFRRPDFGGRPPLFNAQPGLQPFVLATPHHAAVGQPALAGQLDAQQAGQLDAYRQQLEGQLGQLQTLIAQLSAAAGQAGADLQAAQQEYARVAAEYQQLADAYGLSGGQGR